jgi:hypothetical protein
MYREAPYAAGRKGVFGTISGLNRPGHVCLRPPNLRSKYYIAFGTLLRTCFPRKFLGSIRRTGIACNLELSVLIRSSVIRPLYSYAYRYTTRLQPSYRLATSAAKRTGMDTMSTSRADLSHTTSTRDHETDGGPKAKRRKVRKGTRSCWECRRRKMRCIFGSPTDVICTSCQRRGAKCVGQEYPEEISAPLDRSLQMGDRVVRVETLVEQLLKKSSNDLDPIGGCTTGKYDVAFGYDIPTPASISSGSSQFPGSYNPSAVRIR